MPTFKYKGRSDRGELIVGIIEAGSADAVATQLSASGVTPIDITHSTQGADLWHHLRAGNKPTLIDLMMFSRQMYTLLKAGVPITRGMMGLIESTRNVRLVEALREIRTNVESGRDVASSLARHPRIFPPLFVSMVRVGETTGQLDEAFLRISQYLEAEKDTRERIKTAIRYPVIVLVAVGVAIGIMNVLVIPQFAKLFEKSRLDLPWQTQAIVAVSEFSVAWWPFIAVAIVGLIFAVRLYVNTETGRYKWDKLKLALPIVGSIIQRAVMARFARAFSIALRAGVPLIQGLTVVAEGVDNAYVGEHILGMRKGIERGDNLTRVAITTGLFTPVVIQMLAVGEETGAVDDLLSEVAGFYEREVDHDLKYLADAIQPVLLCIIGALVLVLMIGIVLPVWDLAASIR